MRNKIMRVASALLVAVLMSTCAISGTFAKYTTGATGSDSARVAMWGVEITANGDTFSTSYDNTVVSSGSVSNISDLVAPGTSGDMVEMTLSGAPEVDVEVTYESTVSLDGWTVNDAYYCPITVTVNETEISGLDYTSAELFAAAIKSAIDGYSATYDANTDLSTKDDDSLSVSWEWAFEGAANSGQTDAKDTALGDAAAIGSPSTISISITTTVTQVD